MEVEPSSYLIGKKPAGLAIEILQNIARELGYRLEYHPVSINALIAELQSGKADIAVSTLAITEERKRVVDMTEPFYDGGVMAVVRTTSAVAEQKAGFFERLAASFERSLVVEELASQRLAAAVREAGATGVHAHFVLSVAEGGETARLTADCRDLAAHGVSLERVGAGGDRLSEALIAGFTKRVEHEDLNVICYEIS